MPTNSLDLASQNMVLLNFNFYFKILSETLKSEIFIYYVKHSRQIIYQCHCYLQP